MAKCLLYLPCRDGKIAANLSGKRNFDVALNEYAGHVIASPQSDFAFACRGHKWKCLHNILRAMPTYDAYCFMDDDVEISAEEIDELFAIGLENRMNLWQAAVSWDSCEFWDFLYARPYCASIRPTKLVEVMAPVFSREALRTCFPTFNESYSGWGLDQVWAKLLNYQNMGVVDKIQMRHARPIQSDQWVLPGGLRPWQEATRLRQKYGLSTKPGKDSL